MSRSVLIVEDEYLIAMDLQMVLEQNGWRVIGPVGSVNGALRLLESERPSVGLLDVNLGRKFVTPVAEKLRSQNVPFAIASAYERPEQFGGEILAGAPNVGKPANEGKLIAILNELVVD